MRRIHNLARSIALSGLLIAAATPALAGEKDRARQSIAEADAKISAALQAGAAGQSGALSTEAQASLRDAREQLGRGHERQAINAAMKASELADRAMADSQRAQNTANAVEQARTQAAIGAAQDQAAAANARADAAQDAAQQAAAAAEAARAQAAIAAATPPPAPAQTTVTTSTETAGSTVTSGSGTVRKAPVQKRTTTTRTVRTTPKVKTTTTIQQKQ